jgi:hypothetical protein
MLETDRLRLRRYAVVEKETGDLIGRSGVMTEPAWTVSEDTLEIGWVTKHSDHEGEGGSG